MLCRAGQHQDPLVVDQGTALSNKQSLPAHISAQSQPRTGVYLYTTTQRYSLQSSKHLLSACFSNVLSVHELDRLDELNLCG